MTTITEYTRNQLQEESYTKDDLWDKFLELGLFTEDELDLVTSMKGYSINTLNEALFCRYGYNDLNQMEGGE